MNSTPLPVELKSFTAKASSGKVQLDWTTATEINNSGFEIERSYDGKTFFTIGFVKGNGTTTEPRSYSFTDDIQFKATESLFYRLKQVDYNGSVDYSDVVSVVIEMPIEYALDQNYPNPFNPSTVITYSIPQKSNVSLKIYDILGNEIAALVNEQKEAGSYKVQYDASKLSSGVYIYSIQAGEFLETRKMILMK